MGYSLNPNQTAGGEGAWIWKNLKLRLIIFVVHTTVNLGKAGISVSVGVIVDVGTGERVGEGQAKLTFW